MHQKKKYNWCCIALNIVSTYIKLHTLLSTDVLVRCHAWNGQNRPSSASVMHEIKKNQPKVNLIT